MPSTMSTEPATKTVKIRGQKFVIRELTIGEYDDLEKKATTKRPNPVNEEGPDIEVTDRSKLLRLMVLKYVIDPHLTLATLAELPMRVALGLNDVVNTMHFPEEKDAKAEIEEVDDEEDAPKGEG